MGFYKGTPQSAILVPINRGILNGGVVFGGYLRDTIAGIPVQDLDIWFKTEAGAWKYIEDLMIDGAITIMKMNKYFVYGYGGKHFRIPIQSHIPHQIDIVIAERLDQWQNDVDVNMLMFSVNGLSVRNNCNLLAVLHNVACRQFVKFDSCSDKRYRKILKAGWKEV